MQFYNNVSKEYFQKITNMKYSKGIITLQDKKQISEC